MSKKNRQRRGAAAGSVSSAHGQKAAEDPFDVMLSELWGALKAGDPLRTEVATGRCLAVPQLLGIDQDRSDAILVNMTAQGRTQEDAALLRMMVLLGSPAVKRSASQKLADLTTSGIYPADWVSGAGKATPVRAWRRLETLGDEESIVVTFRYGDQEHGFTIGVDLASVPVVTTITLMTGTDLAGLAERIKSPADGFEPGEDITLAQARGRLEEAIANTGPGPDLGYGTAGLLPVVRSRLRRLPAADGQPEEEFTAADRAAAVDEFMASPQAADAVAADRAATRFWAEVLTAYSSRLRGEPPTRMGPHKLEYILRGFAPRTYTLTQVQRRHMRRAVTAWARWSAACRGLDETATELITGLLPGSFDGFDTAYDDPVCIAERAYLADVATSDADIVSISEHGRRRWFAMPPPGQRDDLEQADLLDASDPEVRQAYTAAEFADCSVPDGLIGEDFLAVAQGVIEVLWLGEPDTTWKLAQQLIAEGAGRHDVIHALVREVTAAGSR